MEEKAKKLNSRQQAFINAYLGPAKWNATEAARIAGYTGTGDAIRVTASRLLTHPNISAHIKARLEEDAIPAAEVLARLSEQGRADFAPFLRGLGIELDDEAAQLTRLIKKVTIKRKTFKGVTEEEINFELHDAQAALVHLGRHHKLFTDRTEHSGAVGVNMFGDLTEDEIDKRIAEAEKREASSNLPA